MRLLNTIRYALLAVFCVILLPGSVESFTIAVKPGTDECFFADLQHYDLMLLSYDVLEGGDLLIDFKLFNPLNVQLQDTPGRKDAYYSYNASNPGLHKYCFHNQLTEKKVSFNLNIVKHKVEEKKQSTEQFEFEAELEKNGRVYQSD
ncbi:Transmembrane emp24 domain-containing protein 5 [Entomophthora muscae]|uniref:Transmembrane emp24 domain-containing protein 5 n=2 Tax=Entomophthora muscae TaxID=34485 RepID=A0ACC2UDJ8_9FUNG|nr:Transmembrane emp24 domain-containing protein 5 [Entomophthora muscae]KAJ9084721.1 Transmembrane emp24 domain-containing protein 5 [Entomophthora muscae]